MARELALAALRQLDAEARCGPDCGRDADRRNPPGSPRAFGAGVIDSPRLPGDPERSPSNARSAATPCVRVQRAAQNRRRRGPAGAAWRCRPHRAGEPLQLRHALHPLVGDYARLGVRRQLRPVAAGDHRVSASAGVLPDGNRLWLPGKVLAAMGEAVPMLRMQAPGRPRATGWNCSAHAAARRRRRIIPGCSRS